MKATITKIHPLKHGQQYNASFRRVEFAMENGAWAHTDIVVTFRNYPRWQSLMTEGQTIDGLHWVGGSDPAKLDADSPVVACRSGVRFAHTIKPKGPDPQMSLL